VTSEENGFLLAIKKNPKDQTAHGAFADWLDEHDRHYEAMLQRAAAGLSEVFFKIRRKSDGLFSEASSTRSANKWSKNGRLWKKLADVRSHLANYISHNHYWHQYQQKAGEMLYNGDTAWEDLEIVVVEVRMREGAVIPLGVTYDAKNRNQPQVEFVEPGSKPAT
jgi:uncharacterized protein (TIGR02996 family)